MYRSYIMKIKKGDEVKLASGKDKNKTGKVVRVFPREGSLLVEGLNVFKKHSRPRESGKKGEIILVPKPLKSSTVRLICPSCHKITRVGYNLEGDSKVRICKKCGKTL